MGRDALFNLLSANNMLVKNRKRRVQTTQSFHWLRKFTNLIKDFVPLKPNHLWVSDITYWRIDSGIVYVSFITDAFSHKIVGYNVAKTLASIETIKALKMALSDFLRSPESHFKLIHHSDRGVQYCHHEYVRLLQSENVNISMTETGDPLDNAVAERVNGIIKNHRGCIDIESEAGFGSIFKIYLPVAQAGKNKILTKPARIKETKFQNKDIFTI